MIDEIVDFILSTIAMVGIVVFFTVFCAVNFKIAKFLWLLIV